MKEQTPTRQKEFVDKWKTSFKNKFTIKETTDESLNNNDNYKIYILYNISLQFLKKYTAKNIIERNFRHNFR